MVLGKVVGGEGTNALALTGEAYKLLSANDKAKYEVTIIFGLTALHYLECINKHNETSD